MPNNLVASVASRVRKKLGKLKRRSQKYFLKGDSVECPVCESEFSKFLSTGLDKRKNAVCPNCDSFERHRLLWLYLRRKTDFFQKKLTLLHFAPEDILHKKFNNLPNIKYFSTDISSSNLNVVSDIQNLPFKNNSFDVIICSHVLEHIPNDIDAMKELFRIMKPGGWGILQVPIDKNLEKSFEDPSIKTSKERLKAFGQEDHVRIYGKDFFRRLRDAKFEVHKNEFEIMVSENDMKKYALNEEDMICLISKEAA